MTLCPWCQAEFNEKQPGKGAPKKFCSSSCKNNFYVTQNRRSIKLKALEYKGGKCSRCGYSKCQAALVFHHLYGKDFGISKDGRTRGWEIVKKELDKCILVCANCHAEIHEAERYSQVA